MTARIPLGGPRAGPRAVAVVVRGNKLLVIARRLDGREYAVLPGGRVEPGETAVEAAVRELAEECSLSGRAVRTLFEGDHGGRHATYVRVEVPEGEPVLGGDEARAHSERNHFRPLWATARELPLLGLLPEGVGQLVTEAVWPLRVDVAGAADQAVLERLWQLYQHDLSEFRHSAPDVDGSYASGRLAAYAGPGDVAYLARLGEIPCGFALVRGVGGDQRLMGEFFVTRSTRGSGTAAAFAGQVLERHPGPWVVPFQNENPRAAAFWRRLASDLLGDVSEELRPVPGKAHLPADVWLTGAQPSPG